MVWHNWVALIFLLILVYLFVSNSSGTSTVITALGSQATSLTQTLQGRGSTTGIGNLATNGGLG